MTTPSVACAAAAFSQRERVARRGGCLGLSREKSHSLWPRLFLKHAVLLDQQADGRARVVDRLDGVLDLMQATYDAKEGSRGLDRGDRIALFLGPDTHPRAKRWSRSGRTAEPYRRASEGVGRVCFSRAFFCPGTLCRYNCAGEGTNQFMRRPRNSYN